MSPVSTATRSARGRLSSVFSKRLVLPDPGALIRFRQRVPCSRKRSRNPPAMRSFSLRIFFSSGTRFMFLHFALFHFKICEFKLVSADALCALFAALRALDLVAGHVKFSAARATALPPRTQCNPQFQKLEIGISGQSFEGELQSVRIDCCQLADSDCDLARFRSGMARCFGPDCIQNRIRNPNLVHGSLSKYAEVDRPPACPRCASFPVGFSWSPGHCFSRLL